MKMQTELFQLVPRMPAQVRHEYGLAPEEAIVDLFAGGGGTSEGFRIATGRSPDVAVNHDPIALGLHEANHPKTLHLTSSVYAVNPDDVVPGRPVGILWSSPACTHFSSAKGGAPLDKGIRDLAWVVVHWAERRRPRIILVENVPAFATWGPLLPNGRPDKKRAGEDFERWIAALRRLGYAVETRTFVCADYGVASTRERLFVQARCDGLPIVWPEPTHGRPGLPDVLSGRLLPWITAADIVDRTLPIYSIFLSRQEVREQGLRIRRPLAARTQARIAKGTYRHAVEDEKRFMVERMGGDIIVPITHASSLRVCDGRRPMPTITTGKGGEYAWCDVRLATGSVTMFNQNSIGRSMGEPIGAVLAGAPRFGYVESGLSDEPVDRTEDVRRFLWDHREHARRPVDIDTVGSVMVAGRRMWIADIGLRMFTPRELFDASSFSPEYEIERPAGPLRGTTLSKEQSIHLAGNAVPPLMSAALVTAAVTGQANVPARDWRMAA